MKYKEGESLESWAERVRKYEYGHALIKIANGEDPNEVMDRMSKNIQQKLLHPIYKALHNAPSKFDAEASRKHYEEIMRDKGPVADQIEGNLFDKTE